MLYNARSRNFDSCSENKLFNHKGVSTLKLHISDYISIHIHQADLLLSNYVKNLLVPFNIAPEQNLIMMLLWEKDGLPQTEISAKLKKDKTNIARMISNLEQKDLIHRVSEDNDRRLLRVYLTDKGRELGERVNPVIEEFNAAVVKGITEAELNAVKRILSKMIDNVR
jgi:DNA-binding MarR family transcriptional regulator